MRGRRRTTDVRARAAHELDAGPGRVGGVGVAAGSTVAIGVVRSLLEVAAQRGVAAQSLLRAARLDDVQITEDTARVSRAQVYELCERALEMTGDPALGLHWAERLRDTAFVPVSHLLAHAESLRLALASLVRFHRLLSDELGYRMLEGEGTVTLAALPLGSASPCARRFAAEMMVAGFYRFVRHFHVHARPRCVSFAFAAPAYQAEYSRLFEGPVLFDQPYTGITFDRALLDAPAPHKDPAMLEALEALGERRLLRIGMSTPYALRVREFLVREGWRTQAGMRATARALDLSERSLRRRLEAEGKAYNDIAAEALASVAKQLLRDPRRSVKEVAHEMGFSNTSTFHRAFKRWTKATPSAYREELRRSTSRD